AANPKASNSARPDMIGLPATMACADGGSPTPAKSRSRRARTRRKRRLWPYGHGFGFVGAAALQRPMRRLKFAGAKWGGADDARGVAVRDRASAAGRCRPRSALYLSRQRHWRHHPVVVRERGHGATAGCRLLRALGQVPPHHQRAPAIRRLHRVQLPVVAVHQPLRPAGGADPLQLLLSSPAAADHLQVIALPPAQSPRDVLCYRVMWCLQRRSRLPRGVAMKHAIASALLLLSSPAFSEVDTPPPTSPPRLVEEVRRSDGRILPLFSTRNPRECDAFGCYWDERIKGYWDKRREKTR